MGPMLIFAFLASGCNSIQEKTFLNKASKVHEESAKIESNLNKKLKELVQKKNSINIQGRALTTEELTFVDVIENLESSYQLWRENYQKSALLHDLTVANEPGGPSGEMVYGSGNKTSAKDVYSNQLELRDSIEALKEKVENTYEKWINEV